MNYNTIYEYAQQKRLDYNELCAVLGRAVGRPAGPPDHWVLIATEAYEAGFGKGLQAAERGAEVKNPWTGYGAKAWELGYNLGKKRYVKKVQSVAEVKENPYCPEGMSDELTSYLPVGTKLYAQQPAPQPLTASVIEEAFREGYASRATYNDKDVSDVNDEWAKNKPHFLKLAGIGEQP